MEPEMEPVKVRFLVHLLLIGLLGLSILPPCFVRAQERMRIAYARGGSAVPVWIVQEISSYIEDRSTNP